MPLPLLLALFLAFGFDLSEPEPGPPESVAWAVAQVACGILAVATFAAVVGQLVSRSVAASERPTSRIRRVHALGVRAVDLLSLLVFGAIVHELGWPAVVRRGMGLDGAVLLDEALILLPFVLLQLAGWWGLYPAERAFRQARGGLEPVGTARHLWIKARQSMGMVLPVAGIYGLVTDVLYRYWPEARSSPWVQPVGLGVMGVVVLAMAPALVRLAWSTHPLPAGPLRDRLEHLARRVGFRCTEILVWDTNRGVINAGVTGALPWYRYVLLTDALIEHLSPHEVAAVFGHEIGHIAHRHLIYFGFFILGSLALLSVAEASLGSWPSPGWADDYPNAAVLVQTLGALAMIGGYFLLVFGYLSRRFERQADVYGCRVVSCGDSACPPHADPDGRPGRRDATDAAGRRLARRATAETSLCPVGIRIFVAALSRVAMLNGMQPRKWSWRHGSILRRIDFLEGLIDRPEAERVFQVRVARMRIVTAALLLAVLGAVLARGYWR